MLYEVCNELNIEKDTFNKIINDIKDEKYCTQILRKDRIDNIVRNRILKYEQIMTNQLIKLQLKFDIKNNRKKENKVLKDEKNENKDEVNKRELDYRLLRFNSKISGFKRLYQPFLTKYVMYFDAIRLIHGNKFYYIGETEEILQISSRLISLARMVVIDVLALINFDEDKLIKLYGYIPKIPIEIQNPPKFEPNCFNYDERMKRPINPTMRYIPNIDVNEFYKYYGKEIPTLIDCERDNSKRSIRAMHLLLRDYINQARVLYMHKNILSLIEGTISNSEMYTIDPTISLPLYMIYMLVKDQDDFPFYEKGNKMEWNPDKSISSMVPVLIYCFLNLQIQLIMGNISFKLCAIAITVWMDWARTSLDQLHLEKKGYYTSVFKLLHEKIKNCIVPVYGKGGLLTGIQKIDSLNEIWYENEKNELLSTIKNTHEVFQLYVNKLMIKGISNVEELIIEIMGIGIIANPGNFKKTASILEMEKTVDPRTVNPVSFPKVNKYLNDNFVFEYDFSTVPGMNLIWDEYLSIEKEMIEQAEDLDIEREYFERITNKSAGRRLDDAIRQTLPNKLLPMSRQRLIQALILLDEFYNKISFLNNIAQPGAIGKRSQIDRRDRPIEVVNNLIQSLAVIGYKFSEILSDVIDDLAYGKQVGDIRDMLDQLIASSGNNTYVASIDISGADASTQRPLTLIIYFACLRIFANYKYDKYFWATSQDGKITDVTKNTINIKNISPIQLFIAEVNSYIQTVNFILKDGVFGVDTVVNGLIFWSGLFVTAGQHNTVLALLLRRIYKLWLKDKETNINVNLKVSGDDIMQVITSNDIDEIKGYVTNELNALNMIGFKADPELSKYSGIFLQQVARFGRVSPLPARLSIICSEKGESINKNIRDKMDEIHSIFIELAPRSVYPENWIPIIRAMFNVSRLVRYEHNRIKPDLIKLLKEKKLKQNDLMRFITIDDSNIYIMYPYVFIFDPNGIGTPLPGIITKYTNILPASHLMPMKSDIQKIVLRRLYERNQYNDSDYIMNLKRLVFKRRASKYKLIIGQELGVAESSELWIPQYWLLDKDELEKDGWTFSNFIGRINLEDELQSMRVADVGRDIITDLTNKLIGTQDSDKILRSRKAHDVLIMRGIHLKTSIIYHLSANERILSSLMEKIETDIEFNVMSSFVVNRLLKYNGLIEKEDNEGMFSVIFDWGDEERELSNDYIFNRDVQLLPGLSKGKELERLLTATTFITRKSSGHAMIYSKFNKNKFRGIQIEDIVSEGVKVYNVDKTLMDTFFDVISLPKRLIGEVRNLIIETAQFGIQGFKTIIQPRKYFLLSVNPLAFKDAIEYKQIFKGRYKKSLLDFRNIVCRDYLLSYGHYSKKKIYCIIEGETIEHIKGGPIAASF